MKILLICLSALLLLQFYPLLFGKTLFFGDNYSLLVPGKIYTAMNIRKGILPLWNPYLFIGQSWIGNLNESILYPSTLLFAVFQPATALSLTIVIHTLISGVGSYILSRPFIKSEWARICVVILWLLSSQWIATINNISVIQSASFIPLILFACIQLRTSIRSICILALLIVAQIAGGYPQFTLYCVLFGLIFHFYIYRSIHWGAFVKAGILALLLSALYWMPFLTLLHSSTRSIQTAQQTSVGGLHPLELIKILLPTFFDDPQVGMKWGPFWNMSVNPGLYLGLFSIFSIVWILRKRITRFDIMAVSTVTGSLLLAILGHFGISPLSVLPIFSSSRGSGLVLMPATLLASVWIGSLFERLELSSRVYARLSRIASIVLICSFLSLSVTIFYFPNVWNMVNDASHGRLAGGWHTIDRDRIITTTILGHLSFQLLIFVCIIHAHEQKKFWLLATLLAVDIYGANVGRTLFAPASIYPTWDQIETPIQEPMRLLAGKDRILIANGNAPYTEFATYWDALLLRNPFSDSYIDGHEMSDFTRLQEMRDGMTPDWSMVYGIRSINGYGAFVPKDIDQIFNTSTQPSLNSLPTISPIDERLRKYGVTKYWVDTWYPNDNVSAALTSNEAFGLYRLYPLPSSLSRFRLEDGSPPDSLHVDEDIQSQMIVVDAKKETSLIVADRYDQQWQATVNDQLVKIRDFDGIRKIPLRIGENTIRMHYVPTDFYTGVTISAFTLVLMAALLYKERLNLKKD